jgi:hypothetical protein
LIAAASSNPKRPIETQRLFVAEAPAADHGPQLVVQELLPAVFDVFSKPDPVADRERDLLPLEHAELLRLVKGQLLLDAILSDEDGSLLTTKDLPLLAAFKTLFSRKPCW